MHWKNKVGLGGLLILGVGFGAQANRKMSSREEAIGYYGAQTAMLVGGAALIVAGLRQRSREVPKATVVRAPEPRPAPPPPAPIATVTPPPEPKRDPDSGPSFLG